MTEPVRPFVELRLRGGRYEQHGFPVEVLAELTRYEQLVQDVARGLWKADHPGRQRIPRGFSEGLNLRLTRIEDGSVSPVLERGDSDALFGDLGLDHFTEANDLIEQSVLALSHKQPLPERMPESARGSLLRFGKSFREDERVEFRWTTSQPVSYGPVERRRLAGRLSVDRYSADGAAVGQVIGVQAQAQTFTFCTLSGQELRGQYSDPGITEDLTAVLQAVSVAPVVRLDGELVWTSGGDLSEISDVRSVELFDRDDEPWSDRLVTLLSIPAGWADGDGERIELASVEAAREIIRAAAEGSRDVPGIFPMPDGGVQLEWHNSRTLTSIEIHPSSEISCYQIDLETKEERSQVTSILSEAVSFALETME